MFGGSFHSEVPSMNKQVPLLFNITSQVGHLSALPGRKYKGSRTPEKFEESGLLNLHNGTEHLGKQYLQCSRCNLEIYLKLEGARENFLTQNIPRH